MPGRRDVKIMGKRAELCVGRVKKYSAGYVVKDELYEMEGCEPVILRMAYTHDGAYIGDALWAYRLCKRRGIKPELASPDHRTCSVGFCAAEQKWYGWSHRAMYGFGVGSEVKKGDCAYVPESKEAFIANTVAFWADGKNKIMTWGEEGSDHGVAGVFVFSTYDNNVPNKLMRGKTMSHFTSFPQTYGRGEWTAQTLEDAKQMAVDFAVSVS